MRRGRRKLIWWAIAVFMILVFVGPVVLYVVPRPTPGSKLTYTVYTLPGIELASSVASSLKQLYGAKKVEVVEALTIEDKARFLRAFTLLAPPALAAARLYYPIVVMKGESPSVALALFSEASTWTRIAEAAEARGWIACGLVPGSRGLEYNCTESRNLVSRVLKELNASCPLKAYYAGGLRPKLVPAPCTASLEEGAREYLAKLLKHYNITIREPLTLICSRGALLIVNSTSLLHGEDLEPYLLSIAALPRVFVVSYTNTSLKTVELPGRAQIMLLALCSSLQTSSPTP